MKYYVGIDNANLAHQVQIIDNWGNKFEQFSVSNHLRGFLDLESTLSHYENTEIGFESPHGPIVDFLHAKQYNIFSLNPFKIKRFKESLIASRNKSDKIDAIAIAEYLRKNSNLCRPIIFNSSTIEQLKSLTIIHNRLTGEKTRYLNKLHYTIRQYFPIHESLFYDFGCTTQIKMLINYPNFDSLKSASDNELTEFLRKCNCNRTKTISRIIKQIHEYDQLISADIINAYSIESIFLCNILRTINQSLKELEKQMQTLLDVHPLGPIFKSLPGAGIILSANLLSLFGDNKDHFECANNAQCLFGTAPINYQSGTYHKIIMRKACNKYARAILYRFSFCSLTHCTWARAYNDEQSKRGKTNSVALRALSNKWVKIILKLWKDEIIYDCSKKVLLSA